MTYALVAAAVLYLLVRRFMGEPLNARDLLAPPAFLLFFGNSSKQVDDVGETQVCD